MRMSRDFYLVISVRIYTPLVRWLVLHFWDMISISSTLLNQSVTRKVIKETRNQPGYKLRPKCIYFVIFFKAPTMSNSNWSTVLILDIDINSGQCSITSEFSAHFPLLSVELDSLEKQEGTVTIYPCDFIASFFLTCMWSSFTSRICYWFRTRNCISHHDFHISYWLKQCLFNRTKFIWFHRSHEALTNFLDFSVMGCHEQLTAIKISAVKTILIPNLTVN